MGSASVFSTGSMLAGKYRILDMLGQGGMGAVYLAENVDIGRKVAIKILRPELAEDPSALARFKQEARAATAIGEPGIVEVLDLGMLPDGGAYIVMERLEGETLRERLSRAGTVTPAEAVTLVASVLDTLVAAHDRGVIHRDLKPDNIWLTARPPPLTKILDFGISKFRGTEDMALTRTGVVMGTPLYMSPEQARGSKDVGPSTDIYSIGAILYEALSGQPPFPGESYNEVLAKLLTEQQRPLSALRTDVPPALGDLIEQMLSKTPPGRPPDAKTAARALRGALGSGAMEPLPLNQVVTVSMAQTAMSIAPPVTGMPTSPPSSTRPDQPATKGEPAVQPQSTLPEATPAVATKPPPTSMPTPTQPGTPGPRASMPPSTQKSGGAGLAIGLGVGLIGLVIVGVLGYGGVQKYLEQAKQHGPISTADDAGLVHRGPLERPFPFGTHPAPPEAELCSGQRCVIYAATEHALYELDPHQPAKETFRCNFGGAIAPNNPVSDIAVSEQGALYAITAGELYRIPNPFDCKAELIGRLTPAFAFNGLTFTRAGDLLAADPQGNVARIDPATAAVTLAGTFGSGLGCSGDLVGLADGTVFATARELNSPNLQGDWLVRLDPNTHAATKVATIGLGDIWALADWGTQLIGLDRAGRTIVLDPITAKGQVVMTVPNRVWIGAGVTTLAPEEWKSPIGGTP
ncbi:MAG: protein kinase [Deltaproteobacteria bacterium]|nr:protein kinase [Deltaproteobacteria bacterium]